MMGQKILFLPTFTCFRNLKPNCLIKNEESNKYNNGNIPCGKNRVIKPRLTISFLWNRLHMVLDHC